MIETQSVYFLVNLIFYSSVIHDNSALVYTNAPPPNNSPAATGHCKCLINLLL